MYDNNCKCFHHVAVKVMMFLAGLSAFGFWWATAFKTSLMWMDGSHFFMDVVILSLLVIISKHCGCCGMHKMGGMSGTCNHDNSCKCGDCSNCK